MSTEAQEQLLHATARYANSVLGDEGFRYVSNVVATCRMLALQQDEENNDAASTPDMDALVLAAYLHDISTVSQGFQQHQIASAHMAVEFLRSQHASPELTKKVEQAILVHMTPRSSNNNDITSARGTDSEAAGYSPEGCILYDADKLGRLSGLAVVTSLIELGARYANTSITGDMLTSMLRHIEERFIGLQQSLNTEAARDIVKEKYHNTLAFLDGVIEHLNDATPV